MSPPQAVVIVPTLNRLPSNVESRLLRHPLGDLFTRRVLHWTLIRGPWVAELSWDVSQNPWVYVGEADGGSESRGTWTPLRSFLYRKAAHYWTRLDS